MSDAQQEVLANAVNERLDDLYRAARVPYLLTQNLDPGPCQDPMTVLEELRGSPSPEEKTDP